MAVLTILEANPMKVSKPRALTAAHRFTVDVTPKKEDVPDLGDFVDFLSIWGDDSQPESTSSPLNSYSHLTEDLQPPPLVQQEPNYYALKPKKGQPKKYNPNVKQVHIKKEEKTKEPTDYDFDYVDYDKFFVVGENEEPVVEERGDGEIKAEDLNTGEYIPNRNRRGELKTTASDRDDDDGARKEYQVHGTKGPDSYKFGYDTGKG